MAVFTCQDMRKSTDYMLSIVLGQIWTNIWRHCGSGMQSISGKWKCTLPKYLICLSKVQARLCHLKRKTKLPKCLTRPNMKIDLLYFLELPNSGKSRTNWAQVRRYKWLWYLTNGAYKIIHFFAICKYFLWTKQASKARGCHAVAFSFQEKKGSVSES